MLSGNTETGITVTYQASDATIDFSVPAVNPLALDGSTGRWPASRLPNNILYINSFLSNFPSGLARLSQVQSDSDVQRLVSAMFSGNTETGITVTYQTSDRTFDLVVDTQRTDDAVKDLVGEMVSGNTETGISVTYDSATHTLDFVVGASLSLIHI